MSTEPFQVGQRRFHFENARWNRFQACSSLNFRSTIKKKETNWFWSCKILSCFGIQPINFVFGLLGSSNVRAEFFTTLHPWGSPKRTLHDTKPNHPSLPPPAVLGGSLGSPVSVVLLGRTPRHPRPRPHPVCWAPAFFRGGWVDLPKRPMSFHPLPVHAQGRIVIFVQRSSGDGWVIWTV